MITSACIVFSLKRTKLFGDNLITRMEVFFWVQPSRGFCSPSPLSVWSEKLSVKFMDNLLTHLVYAVHTYFLNDNFCHFYIEMLPVLLNPLTPQRAVRSSFKYILLLVQGLRTGISCCIRLECILTQVFFVMKLWETCNRSSWGDCECAGFARLGVWCTFSSTHRRLLRTKK